MASMSQTVISLSFHQIMRLLPGIAVTFLFSSW